MYSSHIEDIQHSEASLTLHPVVLQQICDKHINILL